MRAVAALAVVGIVLTGLTLARNAVWRSELGMCMDVVGKSPVKSRAHNNLGLAYWNMGRDDFALRAYSRALMLDPGYAAARNNLGIAYAKRGRIDLAVEQFEAVLRIRPDYAKTHYDVGILYRGGNDAAAAIATALAHYNRAVAFSDQGLTDAAIEHYRLALRSAPDYLDARINLGIAYGEKGLVDKAIEHLQAALRLNPNDPVIHHNLANAYRMKGLTDKAEAHLRSARTLQK